MKFDAKRLDQQDFDMCWYRRSPRARGTEHPYLQSMIYRGGGYAIFRAIQKENKSRHYPGSMTMEEICDPRRA